MVWSSWPDLELDTEKQKNPNNDLKELHNVKNQIHQTAFFDNADRWLVVVDELAAKSYTKSEKDTQKQRTCEMNFFDLSS